MCEWKFLGRRGTMAVGALVTSMSPSQLNGTAAFNR